jgi:iron complex transport system substrate-binding protein
VGADRSGLDLKVSLRALKPRCTRAVALSMAVAIGLASHAVARPSLAAQRVVSLNLCTDQLLVLLAPEKVAAVSWLARDPSISFVAPKAARLPTVRSSAEAVLEHRPGLILAGAYGATTTLALLEARGIPVLRVGMPTDFDGISRETTRVAAALGVPERGDALLAEMDRLLASLPHPTRPRRALYWEPRGYTAGPGSLADAVLRAAGLVNHSNGRRIGLEELLAHPPDLLVVPGPAAYPSLATDLLQHPATASIPRLNVPPDLMICGIPATARAAELLAQ